MVIYNRMTKIAHFVLTTEKTLVEGVAKLFWNHIWKLYRLPESIIIDMGTQFTTEVIRELNCMLGINTKLLIAYHLQIDSQTKKINQDLK